MKTLKRYELICMILVMALGTLLHFVYKWSGENAFVGIFGSVNESTWEHLKIFYWPFLGCSVFEYFKLKNPGKGFFMSKAAALLVGMLVITASFYTYSGIIGTDISWINIAIFYIAVFFAYRFSQKVLSERRFSDKNSWGILIFAVFLVLFIVFTFKTPEIGIFEAP
ncbi:MAG: hypothetical protein IJC39_01710 [Firmicutes bacterium]|nr:hypothetical protein [Bacillota bacterium]